MTLERKLGVREEKKQVFEEPNPREPPDPEFRGRVAAR